MLDWLTGGPWPTADEWQATWAFVTVIVAIVAAALALVQLNASVKSRLEQARPYVTVDLAFRSGLILFEVKNSGLTAAENIRFT